jgi:parallel beta-helix repeat protein
MRSPIFLGCLPLLLVAAACGSSSSGSSAPACDAPSPCVAVAASDGEQKVQEAFATAKEGQTIILGEGRFKLSNTLALASNRVTVKGAGRGKTILDFSGQKAGSEGLFAEGVKDLLLEGFTIVDTKGNGVKVLGATGLVFRKIETTWTGPDKTAHGPYGIYPVSSKQVLIEDCVASGASDSGIYVGQSQGVVVRRNEAYDNVAGIEIENTFDADVYENNAHDNTGGILVFDLPGLPQKGGHAIRVHHNQMVSNNTDNFAPQGNIVGQVPRGTGFFVMASSDVEVFSNTFRDNSTVNAGITSYMVTQLEIKDVQYYPYPSRIYVHDNTFEGGGGSPDVRTQMGLVLASGVAAFPGGKVASILYDGIVDEKKPQGPNPAEICLRNNGSATFANLHLDKLDVKNPDLPKIMTFDAKPYDCELPPVAAPNVPGR